MSLTRTKNTNWRRSTTASRRKPMRYLHVSKKYAPLIDPKTQAHIGYLPLPGSTYDVGRNAAKRARRAAGF